MSKPVLHLLPKVLGFVGSQELEPPGTTIGERLRAARTAAGLSIATLATKWSVDPTTLRNWEVGRSTPSVRYVPRILELTGPEKLDEVVPLASRVHGYRRVHGLRQADLARLLGTTQQNVSEWERGAEEPTKLIVRKLESMLRADKRSR